MRELRIIAWLNHARLKMREIAEGGDGRRIATEWLRDFEVDVRVAASEEEPRSEFYGALVYLNEVVLKKRGKTPLLVESGVHYDPNPMKENWSTVDDVLASGRGDVEDLAAWRAAELRLQGENATVALRGTPGQWLTCVVIRGDGTEEDVTKLVPRHYEPGKCLECGRGTLTEGKVYCLRHRFMEVNADAFPDLDAELERLARGVPKEPNEAT